ncbi:MAG: DMT family transporter [Candidatus Kerfeldbacteria bacterium]|nr:DMT family transporter [Candidatus Kerfeldbacteria bacterium]
MPTSLVLLSAFIALLAWGVGDFLIQRTVRRIGSLEALFFIGLFGGIVLAPFGARDAMAALGHLPAAKLLWGTLAITILSSMVEFEAFRRGKLAVIEPVISAELIFTIIIALVLLGEQITGWQTLFTVGVVVGVTLTIIRHSHRRWWQLWQRQSILETGVYLGIFAALGMAVANVLTGLASRVTTPLATIWFAFSGLAVFTFIILVIRRRARALVKQAVNHWPLILSESAFDTAAWLAYAVVVTELPIAITIAITESYVALAAILGMYFNRERLQSHQRLGVAVALGSAIILAAVSAR